MNEDRHAIQNLRIAVGIVTYRRPEGLARLLISLNELTFFQDEPPDVSIIVVDNDSDGSAETVVESLRSVVRWPILYHVEPRRGIPHARNAVVAQAGDTADFIAFIDDDEEASPTWLVELLRVQQPYQADVVTGPVLPRFIEPPPRWILRGRFFEGPRHTTGKTLDRAYTGNVLVAGEVFRKMEHLFDERMTLTGGSDEHFFRRVHRAGFKTVWAGEAAVYEWQPGTRTTVRWLAGRAFRTGNSRPTMLLDIDPFVTTLAFLLFRSLLSMGLGLVKIPLGLVLGRHVFVHGVRNGSTGLGILLGLMGYRYQEYRTIHGR